MAASAATKAEALRLREVEGWTLREIAEHFEVSKTTIWRWLVPGAAERDRQSARDYKDRNREQLRAYNREYNRTHKGECPECGGEMARETVRYGGKCAACRADEVDRRARQIERWWAEGLLMKEIAERLGWPLGSISVEMSRLREKGYDLPYRRLVFPAGRPKYPELAR